MSNSYLNNLVKRVTVLAQQHLSKDIVALYLRGSASRDEWVPGLSDTDFYIVVKNEVLGNIPSRQLFEKKLNPIIEDVTHRWPKSTPSFRVAPLKLLSKNSVGSFLTGVDALLLLGLDVLRRVSPPSPSDLSRFGVTEFDRFSTYWTRRAREGRVSNSLSEEAAYHEYVVLKLAQTALLTMGSLKVRKQEIADSFREGFADSGLTSVVDKAQRLRTTWPTALPRDMRSFMNEATFFPKALNDYLLARSSFHL